MLLRNWEGCSPRSSAEQISTSRSRACLFHDIAGKLIIGMLLSKGRCVPAVEPGLWLA